MSPVGCWRPPTGIWTKVFGLIAAATLSDGFVASASPYRLPVATCVTGRSTWPGDTTSGADAAGRRARRGGAAPGGGGGRAGGGGLRTRPARAPAPAPRREQGQRASS